MSWYGLVIQHSQVSKDKSNETLRKKHGDKVPGHRKAL